jgi:hypothetical protein
MSGDFSRSLFDPGKHYSGVLMQQGRVQLDADWNEQLAISLHRTATQTRDVIGDCGTPKSAEGFQITLIPGQDDLQIGAGRFYVGGLTCELDPALLPITLVSGAVKQVVVPNLSLDGRPLIAGQWLEVTAADNATPLLTQITLVTSATLTLTLNSDTSAYQNQGQVYCRRAVTYSTQPDQPNVAFPGGSPLASPLQGISLADGTYLVYLEAWQREVSALADARIREVALGGSDTSERLQTVWRVDLLAVDDTTSPPNSPPSPPNSPPSSSGAGALDCRTDYSAWQQLIAPMTGLMNARTAPPGSTTACQLPPTAGYLLLENQLYRVEVFQGGPTLAQATFVWSRENASVETSIVKIDGADVYVHDLGKDDVLSFSDGDWVEIVDPAQSLGPNRFLAQITVPPDLSQNKVTLSTSAAPYAALPGLTLRRWDMTGPSVTASGIPLSSGWLDLEGGIQVSFAEGSYKSGAYWQIPARTATAQIEWPPYEGNTDHPIPQPPLGGQHHYCLLAMLTVASGVWAVQDCRKRFPHLTNICADDICYESKCDMPGVSTVQEALDTLCVANDLRHHNKNLHGWGIVCGLQVNCIEEETGVPRQRVVVRSGYAIDCNGNDVILDKDVEVNIMDMLSTSPPSYTVPDGDRLLILDPGRPGQFKLDSYTPKPWNDLLPGSLVWDFWQNCIQNLRSFYNNQFVPSAADANLVVGPAQKRLTALLNLLYQIVNPTNGSFVFLSGDSVNPTQDQEHSLLLALYQATRAELQSKSYCAMFDSARPFPAYPYAGTGITTIYGQGFGKGYRTRMRIDPTGSRAYTMGVDDTVQVYDLVNQRLDSVLTFPGGGIVMDVAFSAGGTQLYAVSNLNNTDTILAIADVNGLTHTWRQPTTVICNIMLVTLATRPAVANMLYALGRGQGLYEINLQNISATPSAKFQFNAYWHLVIHNDLAYATVAGGAGFASVVQLTLGSTLTPPIAPSSTYTLPANLSGTSDDDILVSQSTQPGVGDQLYLTAALNASSNKQLVTFPVTGAPNPGPGATVDLAENTAIRLAFNTVTNYLMLTMEDSYRIALFRSGALDPTRFPVQIQPLAITAAQTGNNNLIYVMNYLSNTLTAIPATLLDPTGKLDMTALVNYRTAAIEAYVDLVGHFLQYLKDCFCDQLLVNCPSCDETKQLALASVSITGNQIHKVCNFSGRKYVKSFPTIGYWLSLVPIGPFLAKAVETICCAALPDLFGAYKPPAAAVNPVPSAPSGLKDRFKALSARSTIAAVQQSSVTSVLSAATSKASLATTTYADFTRQKVLPPVAPSADPVALSDLTGQSASAATAKLNASGISVDHVATYDPGQFQSNLAAISAAPHSVPPGGSVTLVADQQGIVRYYVPSPPAIAALRSDVASAQKTLADQQTSAVALANQVTTLNSQIVNLQTTHAQELALRDQQIASLTTTTQALQQQMASVNDLKTQVVQLASTVKTLPIVKPG